MRRTFRHATTAALTIFLTGCVTTDSLQPGNPLPGIGLQAADQNILLSWDPESPVGRSIRGQRRIELVATYPSRGGLVQGERVATAQVHSGLTGVQFRLPDTLQNLPTGPVCLRFSPQRGRSLPVRIAKSGESSDGFYYREWEAKAALVAQHAEMDIDKQRLTTRLAEAEAVGASFARWSADRDIQQASQCETLQPSKITTRPPTALTGSDKVQASRRHCVAQLNRLDNDDEPIPASRRIAETLNNVLGASHPQSATVQQMIADTNEFGRGRYILPDEYLPLTQTTSELRRAPGTAIDSVLASAIVDAYSSCRSESENQLEASYQQWLQLRNIEASGAQVEPVRQECRARFESESNRLEAVADMEADLARVETELAAILGTTNTVLPAQKALVGDACPSTRAPI